MSLFRQIWPYWPYDLMARIQDALRHCYRRKQWVKPSHLTELNMLFSVLALLDASVGMIELWFQYHDIFEQIRIIVASWDIVFAQNLAILEQFSVKIVWHEPNVIPTSSPTSLTVIQRLTTIIFFTCRMFSSVVDVLEWPGRASSLTTSRPSLNRYSTIELVFYS